MCSYPHVLVLKNLLEDVVTRENEPELGVLCTRLDVRPDPHQNTRLPSAAGSIFGYQLLQGRRSTQISMLSCLWQNNGVSLLAQLVAVAATEVRSAAMGALMMITTVDAGEPLFLKCAPITYVRNRVRNFLEISNERPSNTAHPARLT